MNMDAMTNQTLPPQTPAKKLSKGAVILLIVSLALAILFITIGAILINSENTPSTYSYKVYAYPNKVTSLSAYYGKNVSVEFTPTVGKTYKIYAKNVRINRGEDSSGYRVNYSYRDNDKSAQYDECYSVYLEAYETYTFEIYVTSGQSTIYFVPGY